MAVVGDPRVLGVVLFVFTGCGGDARSAKPPPPASPRVQPSPVFKSGSRLRARYLDGGDGAVQLLGFHDQKLDVDCNFYPGEDGVTRCLPELTGPQWYAEDTCTNPMAVLRSCEADEGWYRAPVVRSGATRCDANVVYRAYRVGKQTTVTPTFVSLSDHCDQSSSSVADGSVVVMLEPAQLEEFVAAKSVIGDMSGHLAARTWEADDGAMVATGLFDLDRAKDCIRAGQGNAACVPTGEDATVSSDFADAACTNELARANDCETVSYALGYKCGQATIRDLGAPIAGPLYGGAAGGRCVETKATNGIQYFPVGDDIATTFPQIAELRLGTGRLRVVVSASGETPLAARRGFVDTKTGEPCVATDFGESTLRCAPEPSSNDADQHFGDPLCSMPLVSFSVGSAACPAARPLHRLRSERVSDCRYVYELFEVGDDFDGEIYAVRSGTCTLITPGATVRHALFGDTVDPATLPALPERTE